MVGVNLRAKLLKLLSSLELIIPVRRVKAKRGTSNGEPGWYRENSFLDAGTFFMKRENNNEICRNTTNVS
jgi:hypothetical protein